MQTSSIQDGGETVYWGLGSRNSNTDVSADILNESPEPQQYSSSYARSSSVRGRQQPGNSPGTFTRQLQVKLNAQLEFIQ